MLPRPTWFLAVLLSLAPASSLANPFGGSTAAGSANTRPLTAPELSPGRVETRAYEAHVAGGGNADGGKTLQAGARLPILFGDSDPEDQLGFLVDPGVRLRLDRDGVGEGRIALDASGAGILVRGVALHSSREEIREHERRVSKTIAQIREILRANRGRSDDMRWKRETTARIIRVLRASGIVNDSYAIRSWAESIRNGLNPEDLRHAWIVEESRPRTEASAVGEVTFLKVGYRYDDNRPLGTHQNGALLSLARLEGHAAVRVSDFVNVGICGSVSPAEFLLGKSRDISRMSVSAEGCADVTVGELPTVRNRFGATFHLSTSDEDHAPNGAYRYANSVTIEKKLGDVTPSVGWTYEMERSDRGGEVSRHLFMVGVAH
jgi:hypothetical protein